MKPQNQPNPPNDPLKGLTGFRSPTAPSHMSVASRDSALMIPFPAQERFSTVSSVATGSVVVPDEENAAINRRLAKYQQTEAAQQMVEEGLKGQPLEASTHKAVHRGLLMEKKSYLTVEEMKQEVVRRKQRMKYFKRAIFGLLGAFVLLTVLFFVV